MSDGPEALLPQQAQEVYGFLIGGVDIQAVQRVANAVAVASAAGVQRAHLLFQSSGGSVADGICIYNIFRQPPIEIVLYNAGTLGSIAVVAFLGAQRRISSRNATFMIHKAWANTVSGTSDRMQAITNALALDDQRIEEIFHHHLELSSEQWRDHKIAELWLSADEALNSGLVTEIADFSPPRGAKLFYLGPV